MAQIPTVNRLILLGLSYLKDVSTVLQPGLSRCKLMGQSIFGPQCIMWRCNNTVWPPLKLASKPDTPPVGLGGITFANAINQWWQLFNLVWSDIQYDGSWCMIQVGFLWHYHHRGWGLKNHESIIFVHAEEVWLISRPANLQTWPPKSWDQI